MKEKKGQISTFEAKETKTKKKSPAGLVFFVAIIVAAAYFVVSGIQIIQLNQEKAEADERYAQLLNIKEDLTAEYANVSSEKYIERVARRDLKLVRGNELLFIMPETTSTDKAGPVYDENADEEGKDETEDGKTED